MSFARLKKNCNYFGLQKLLQTSVSLINTAINQWNWSLQHLLSSLVSSHTPPPPPSHTHTHTQWVLRAGGNHIFCNNLVQLWIRLQIMTWFSSINFNLVLRNGSHNDLSYGLNNGRSDEILEHLKYDSSYVGRNCRPKYRWKLDKARISHNAWQYDDERPQDWLGSRAVGDAKIHIPPPG